LGGKDIVIRKILLSAALLLAFVAPSRAQSASSVQRVSFPINAQTASYPVTATDFALCKLVTMNSSAATTVTLLATAPPSGKCLAINNYGTGTVSISPNGLNLNGSSVTVTLPSNQGMLIVSDGTGYYTLGGLAANPSLSNLITTALNKDLLCASAGSCNLGSALDPIGSLWLSGQITFTTSSPIIWGGPSGSCGTPPAVSSTAGWTICIADATTGAIVGSYSADAFTQFMRGVSPMTNYGLPYLGGDAKPMTALAPPAVQGVYNVTYAPTTSAAVAPTVSQVGLGSRSISGSTTTDTISYSDVKTVVVHVHSATGTVGETLPTATTLNNANFSFDYCNDSPQTDTITPTTWTIQTGNAVSAASLSVSPGTCYRIHVDPSSSTNWLADASGAGAGGSGNMSTTATNTMGSAGKIDMSAETSADGDRKPNIANCAPTLGGSDCFDSTQLADVFLSSGIKVARDGTYNIDGYEINNANALCASATTCATGGTNIGTTETAFPAKCTVPANGLAAHVELHIESDWRVQGQATVPTFTLRLRWGGVSGTLLWSSVTTPSAGTTRGGQIWNIQGTTAPGSSVVIHEGLASCIDSFSATAGPLCTVPAGDAPTVSTSTSNDVVYTAQFSAATAGNYFQLNGLTCSIKNIP
jgi:hypothetical protein